MVVACEGGVAEPTSRDVTAAVIAGVGALISGQSAQCGQVRMTAADGHKRQTVKVCQSHK